MKRLTLLALVCVMIPLRADDDADKPLATDDQNAVALYEACAKGSLDDVKNLVGSGAPVDGQVGWVKMTPLMAAVCKGHLDVMKYLLDYRAKIDFPDAQGSTALLHACFENQYDCALALIDAGADVSKGSQYGRTPLMYAAQRGEDRVVKAMIDHKVDLNAMCNQGSALMWAANANQLSTVRLLVEAGADPNPSPKDWAPGTYTALGDAAANDDLQMINYLIDHKADVNGHGANDITPLMSAVLWIKADAVSELLDKGAKVDATDSSGDTALIDAAYKGDAQCTQLLLDHKADPNATESHGYTALQIAGERGDVDVVDLLKHAGAKVTDVHILPKDQPNPPLPPARSWALAVAAIYTQRAGGNPHILGGDRARKSSEEMLKRDWDVTDRASLLEAVGTLHDVGEHTGFQTVGGPIAMMSDEQFAAFVAQHADHAAQYKALRIAYNKWKDRTGLAWDICRAANIVNCGYDAKFLSEKEAWSQLMDLARQAQSSFSSWQELSDNFLDGREVSTGKRDPRFDACAKLLLDPKETNSAWTQNPWATDLSAD